MKNHRRQFIILGVWVVGLMAVSGFIRFGDFLPSGHPVLGLGRLNDKAMGQAWAASRSIDPRPLLAFIQAMGAFDNAPKGDKTLPTKFQNLQHLAPRFLATSRAVVKELKAQGLWNEVDAFLYAEAAKDRLPAQLLAEVKSLGGPRAVLENLDRFIAEDLKARGKRIAAVEQESIFDAFAYVGTAYAGTACSIGAFGATAVMKVFGWFTKKDYSKDVEKANLKYCIDAAT